ncbi:MAG: hypothetical protein K0S74_1211 [Chlamydiales bacterium]|nr:hypothetical protein [Chlamydiales bacterium]
MLAKIRLVLNKKVNGFVFSNSMGKGSVILSSDDTDYVILNRFQRTLKKRGVKVAKLNSQIAKGISVYDIKFN